MKKLLLLIPLLLLASCGNPQPENAAFIDNHIVEVAKKLTIENKASNSIRQSYKGEANIVLDLDDSIGFIKATKDYVLMIEIDVYEVFGTSFSVSIIDVSFYDTEQQIATYMAFYHYGEILPRDYKAETINMRRTYFMESLTKMNDADVWYMLERLETIK